MKRGEDFPSENESERRWLHAKSLVREEIQITNAAGTERRENILWEGELNKI